MLLERLAEERIREAIDRGELNDLPGSGRPQQFDAHEDLIAPEVRSAYRMLKNAGYLPEPVRLRREIADAETLLQAARSPEERHTASARLRALLACLADERGHNVELAEAYYHRVLERLSGDGKPDAG